LPNETNESEMWVTFLLKVDIPIKTMLDTHYIIVIVMGRFGQA